MTITARMKIIKANEEEPTKISFREISGSSKEPFIVRALNPKGGVNNPISTPSRDTIPNHTKSPFKEITVGRANGTIISSIDVESINMPKKINKIR